MIRAFRFSSSAAAALALTLAPAAWAQSAEADLRQEIEELKQGQEQIQKDIAELKRLLQARPAPAAPTAPSGPNVADVVFDLGDNPIQGERTAKVTLVEFTDYQ